MEELIKWLEARAKDSSPNSQTIYVSILKKIEEFGAK